MAAEAGFEDPYPETYIAKNQLYWVAVKELKLSYHNPETILFAAYPSYGD